MSDNKAKPAPYDVLSGMAQTKVMRAKQRCMDMLNLPFDATLEQCMANVNVNRDSPDEIDMHVTEVFGGIIGICVEDLMNAEAMLIIMQEIRRYCNAARRQVWKENHDDMKGFKPTDKITFAMSREILMVAAKNGAFCSIPDVDCHKKAIAMRCVDSITDEATGIWTPVSMAKTAREVDLLDRAVANVIDVSAGAKQSSDVRGKFLEHVWEVVEFRQTERETIGWMAVPCQNGVYDLRDHTFTEWADAAEIDRRFPGFAFLSKNGTNFNPNAQKPADFDVFAWQQSLFPDTPEGKLSAKALVYLGLNHLRGYPGKAVRLLWFTNNSANAQGRGGKSTELELMEHIAEGPTFRLVNGQTVPIPNHAAENNVSFYKASIAKLCDNNNFSASGMVRKTAIHSDEQATNKSIYSSDDMRTILRCQEIEVEEKYKGYYWYRPTMPKVAACNDLPRIDDKSGAVTELMGSLRFEMTFTNTSAVKVDSRIKEEYIKREDVLEWMVYTLLTRVPVLDEYPDDILKLLQANVKEIKDANIPSLEFIDLLVDEFSNDHGIDTIPVKMMYELYTQWNKKENAGSIRYIPTKNRFKKDVIVWASSNGWTFEDDNGHGRKLTKQEAVQYRNGELFSVIEEYGTPEMAFVDHCNRSHNFTYPYINADHIGTTKWCGGIIHK